MRVVKRIYIVMVVITVFSTVFHPNTTIAASSSMQQKIHEVQEAFVKENKLDKSKIIQTLTYDVNNDGSSEIIILGGDLRHDTKSKGYIGVYTKQGKHLLTQKFNNSFLPFHLRKIRNETYKNCLGVISLPGASGGSLLRVMAFSRGGEFKTLLTTASSEEGFIIKDTNRDLSDEIIGYELSRAEEYRHLPHASTMLDKFIYSWNKNKKVYIKSVYGQDRKIRTVQKDKNVQLDSYPLLTKQLLSQGKLNHKTLGIGSSEGSIAKILGPKISSGYYEGAYHTYKNDFVFYFDHLPVLTNDKVTAVGFSTSGSGLTLALLEKRLGKPNNLIYKNDFNGIEDSSATYKIGRYTLTATIANDRKKVTALTLK